MYLDSDYDEDDEDMNSEMDELFNLSAQPSDEDDIDDDDDQSDRGLHKDFFDYGSFEKFGSKISDSAKLNFQ